jgi:predicted transcriptional regulator
MKMTKALIISFKNLDELKEELLDVFKTRIPKVQSKNMIYFDNINSFRGFMTFQKIEILSIIANIKPKSIYELAQILERSLAPVQKDCQILERIGFIKFQREKGGRGSIKPILRFNYDRIIIKLPKHPLELRIRKMA